jgi:hypothetical protein
MLGSMMTGQKRSQNLQPSVLDAVALLDDDEFEGLPRGQVGTVVESLGDDRVLVEFSDDDGRAYAVVPCRNANLLVLHYAPETA